MEEKIDMRIRKNRVLLSNALLELMKDKTFEEIKVTDICEKAMVNRSTFYAHYDDKYELLHFCIHNIEASLNEELTAMKSFSSSREYFLDMARLFIDHIEDHAFYKMIVEKNRYSIACDMVIDAIYEEVLSRTAHNEKEPANPAVPYGIMAKFYINGLVAIGFDWIKGDLSCTKDELMGYIDALIISDSAVFPSGSI